MLHQHLMLWGQSAKKLKIGTVVNSYFLPLMKYTTESTLTPEERFKDAVLYFISDVSILGFLVSVCRVGGEERGNNNPFRHQPQFQSLLLESRQV